MKQNTDVSLDSILANLISTNVAPVHRENEKPLTTWVPKDYKDKYARVQDATGRKFSKTLKEIIITAIEKADREVSSTEELKKSSGF